MTDHLSLQEKFFISIIKMKIRFFFIQKLNRHATQYDITGQPSFRE